MYVMVLRDNDHRERRKLLLAGVVYVVVVTLLLGLSVAIYGKAFTEFTRVTLRADKAGLQLPELGDVRYNGVLVGQIRDVSQSGDEAVIQLGLEPEAARELPRDFEVNIMPTTLFGQKFVSIVALEKGGVTGIEDGTVLPPERVHTTVELDAVLARLFPLLRTVRPQDLSATLSALATALSGRGEQLGDTLVQLDDYLTDINAHLPTLQEDLRLLASVAQTYNVAAPDLVAALGNLSVTSRTVSTRSKDVGATLGSVADLGTVGARILERNERDAVEATRLSVPLLRVLDKYSPEYNCLLRGISAYKPILRKTFEGGEVKQFIEFPATQVRSYDERDLPEYTDTRGPNCYGLPNNPPTPWPGLDLSNGTDLDSERGRGNTYTPGGEQSGSEAAFFAALRRSLSTASPASYDGGATRRSATAVLSARSGHPAGSITTLSTLLYTPMAAGGVA